MKSKIFFLGRSFICGGHLRFAYIYFSMADVFCFGGVVLDYICLTFR